MNWSHYIPLLIVVATACGQSQFQSKTDTRRPAKKAVAAEAAAAQPVDGAAGEAAGFLTANVLLQPKLIPNDLLFVIDNSISMNEFLGNVRSGFDRLGASDWVANSRLAVMTTMPASATNLSQPHPAIARYVGIEREPGFLSFVSSAQVNLFRSVPNNPQANAYPQPVCADEWFGPTSTNSNGQRCLSVALQNPYTATVCEAGMTALSQILDKRSRIFREGAFAQIIFISDAQDPGCPDASLMNLRPTADALKAKILEKNKLEGLRFHGVLPVPGGGTTKETRREGTFGFPYNQLVTETKGLLIDITRGNDYSGFAQALAQSDVDAAVKLPEKASRIRSVSVGGKLLESSQWKLSEGGLTLTLTGYRPKQPVEVVVQYSK